MDHLETNKMAAPAPAGAGAPPGTRDARRPAKARRQPGWLRWSLALLLVALLGVVGYAATLGYTLVGVSTRIYHPDPPTPRPETATALATAMLAPLQVVATPAPGEPTWTPAAPTTTMDAAPTGTPEADTTEAPLAPGRINILVLGTDKRTELGAEAARSDTLIIASIDPQWKTAGILSVPRDLQVSIPGYGLQKINAAYFFGELNKIPGGGPVLALSTVRQFFKVPIQYYVSINFEGFVKVIDTVGGIDLYVPEAIDDPEYPGPYNSIMHIHFNQGCQHMDGEQALQYARTRHADSDFGRSRRQQQVIKAVREKVTELNMLPRYGDLLTQLGDAVETNIPPDQQLALVQLAGQIKSPDLYTAQIDSTLVREVAGGTGNLELRRDKAKPVLDWFFGRGIYASLRPGTVLTPVPSPTQVEVALGPLATAPVRLPAPTPHLPLGGAGLEGPTQTPAHAEPSPTDGTLTAFSCH